MFDFDYEVEKTPEQKEKELYEKTSKKQFKLLRKILVTVFSFLGIAYLIIGIIALIIGEDYDMQIVGYVFGGLGIIFLIVGIILFFVIPKEGNYQKYKERQKLFGIYNNIGVNTNIVKLEEENKDLKERVSYLEKKINEMENKQ